MAKKENKHNTGMNFEVGGGTGTLGNDQQEEQKVFNNDEYEFANDPYALGGNNQPNEQSAFGNIGEQQNQNNNLGGTNMNQNQSQDYSNIGQQGPGYFDTNMNAQQWANATLITLYQFQKDADIEK